MSAHLLEDVIVLACLDVVIIIIIIIIIVVYSSFCDV
jgi:hypothetical protein